MTLEFRLLGPLEVQGSAGELALGGTKQRVALALLVLHADQFVSRDALVDALWPESPPPTAAHTIESYISRLRRLLRDPSPAAPLLESAPAGYRLLRDGCHFDHHAFAALAADAEAALGRRDHATAAAGAREALALWRGPALAGLAGERALRVDAAALDERRVRVFEVWAAAELGLGRHAGLIGELGAEASRHPEREKLQELLMLALYRAGRQAGALEVYRDARGHLVDELGLEPGPELRALQERILRHDPALAAPAAAMPEPSRGAAAAPPSGAAASAPRRRRGATALLALALTLTVGGGVALFLTRDADEGSAAIEATLRTPALGLLDGATGRARAAVALPAAASRLTTGLGAVWATAYDDGTLLRIDPQHEIVTQTIHVGHGPTGVAVAAGDVWVADTLDNAVSRVDGTTSEIVQRIAVGTGPTDVAAGAGAVWVSNSAGGTVSRIDAHTGAVLTTTRLGGAPAGIAVGAGSVWVAENSSGAVARLDPRTGRLRQEIHVGSGPSAISVGAGGVWVANQLDSTVSRIDPARDNVTLTRAVVGTPTALAAVGSRLWVGARDTPTLTQLTASGTTRTAALRSPAGALTPDTVGRLLVGVRGLGLNHRGGTLIARSAVRLSSVSPYECCNVPLHLRSASYDGLLAFSKAPGSANTVVPDLALQVPRPEAGGRVYRFRLRPGLRYWTGAPVLASDVRRGFEHAARTNDLWASYLKALPGALTCADRSRRCDLRAAITTSDRDGTIALHLSHPDPELLLVLALPTFAPAPPGNGETPGTGPYRVARFLPGRQLDLQRNRFFRLWAPAAQPPGYPNRIVWNMGGHPAGNVAAVLSGRADYTFDPPTARQHNEIMLHAPGQLHILPLPGLNELILNTRAAPFDDVRVRRALNFAVDRAAIARLFGGTSRATPICQILPATIGGHQPYCPYTRHSSRAGQWTGPDLPRARRLIAAARNQGTPVTILTQPGDYADEPTARYFAGLLRKLGYRARLRSLRNWDQAINNARNPPQAVTNAWYADYPSASQWITQQLSCAAWNPPARTTNHAHFCDPTVDRWARRATRLQTTDPVAANRLWARADRRVTNQAPWVPTVSEATTDLVSRRVSNYHYVQSFAWLDQLWVR